MFTQPFFEYFRLNPTNVKICQQFPELQIELCAKIHGKVSSQHSSLKSHIQSSCDRVDLLCHKCEVILTRKVPKLDLSEIENVDENSASDPVNHPDLSTLLNHVRDMPYDLTEWKRVLNQVLSEIESEMAKQGSSTKTEKLVLDSFPNRLKFPDGLRGKLTDIVESSKFVKASQENR